MVIFRRARCQSGSTWVYKSPPCIGRCERVQTLSVDQRSAHIEDVDRAVVPEFIVCVRLGQTRQVVHIVAIAVGAVSDCAGWAGGGGVPLKHIGAVRPGCDYKSLCLLYY